MNLTFIVSVLLFLIGVYMLQEIKTSKIIKLFSLVLYVSYILMIGVWIGSYYFTSEGITSSVIYHLNIGLAGAGFQEYWGIILGLISLIVIGVIIWYALFIKKKKSFYSKKYLCFGILILIVAMLINPTSIDLYDLYVQANKEAEVGFDKYYKEPNIKEINKNKNLVFIYAESLERTYFDEKIFPGLMKNIKELQKRSTYFTDIRHVSRTGFTMGGGW